MKPVFVLFLGFFAILIASASPDHFSSLPEKEELGKEDAFYSKKSKREEWKEAKSILEFMKDGWVMLPNILPQLRNATVSESVKYSIKEQKFDYIRNTILLAEDMWNFDPSDAHSKCGPFHKDLLNKDNLENDDIFNSIYNEGLVFMKCLNSLYVHKKEAPHGFACEPLEQIMNIHRTNPILYDSATSPSLGMIAAKLLRHNKIRLYQTAVYLKDEVAINTDAKWHRDLESIPLDTKEVGSVTIWCPIFRDLSYKKNDSILRFFPGSHRDMSRAHWYTWGAQESFEFSQSSFLKIGDCTAHHGWVLHQAPLQPNTDTRVALSFTYVFGDARVLNDMKAVTSNRYMEFKSEGDMSYRDWIKDLKEGDVINHPLLPVVNDMLPIYSKNTIYSSAQFDKGMPDAYLHESF